MLSLRGMELDAPELPPKIGDAKDYMRFLVMSFQDDIPRTLYIIHEVMKKYIEKKYRADMFWALEDLYPKDKGISFEEFERAMRYSVCLCMFERRKKEKTSLYRLI